MKRDYVLLFALGLSIISLWISTWVLWRSTLDNDVASEFKEVEIINGIVENVIFDSKVYHLSLLHFSEYAEKTDLKIETSSGYSIRTLYLGKSILTFDLRIIFKETCTNSIVVWIEQIKA